jgi:hypothetical protein
MPRTERPTFGDAVESLTKESLRLYKVGLDAEQVNTMLRADIEKRTDYLEKNEDGITPNGHVSECLDMLDDMHARMGFNIDVAMRWLVGHCVQDKEPGT